MSNNRENGIIILTDQEKETYSRWVEEYLDDERRREWTIKRELNSPCRLRPG